MSQYQYYEFLAIDRPLTAEAIAYVRTLSRRVQPTASHAVFTYAYGDLPADPLALLTMHYDALLHLASWGSKQLAFRFPRNAVDLDAFTPYAFYSEAVEIRSTEQYVLVNIDFHEEQGSDWIEGEGWLAELSPLRADLLQDDLRALYLAWLAVTSRHTFARQVYDAIDPEEWDAADVASQFGRLTADLVEPPVPLGLGQLTSPLRSLVDFFRIDQDLVAAAALASPPLTVREEPIAQLVQQLSEAERNAFLVRAAHGEPISAELLRRLRMVSGLPQLPSAPTPRRRFDEISTAAHEIRRDRQERERQEREQARLAHLEAPSQREPEVWLEVEQLLAQRTARGYDEAVASLAQLRDLAVHHAQQASFNVRLQKVLVPYARSTALQRRLWDKQLM